MLIKFKSILNGKRIFLFLMVFTSIFFSCYQDVMDIDLSGIKLQLVIEGIITDQPGSCRVKISKTGDYFEPDVFPPVSDAFVMISDNEENSVVLEEIRAGIYCDYALQGVPGKTYTLKVIVEDKEYTAVSTMPKSLELDSLNYAKYDLLTYYFTDRKGIEDYCRTKIYINGILDEEAFYLYNGRFTDGEQIVVRYYLDFNAFGVSPHNSNIYVSLELLTLDKSIYEYFSMLYDEYHNLGVELPDFIPVTSFNPTTNLSNNALGYFSAHTIRTYSFVVE